MRHRLPRSFRTLPLARPSNCSVVRRFQNSLEWIQNSPAARTRLSESTVSVIERRGTCSAVALIHMGPLPTGGKPGVGYAHPAMSSARIQKTSNILARRHAFWGIYLGHIATTALSHYVLPSRPRTLLYTPQPLLKRQIDSPPQHDRHLKMLFSEF